MKASCVASCAGSLFPHHAVSLRVNSILVDQHKLVERIQATTLCRLYERSFIHRVTSYGKKPARRRSARRGSPSALTPAQHDDKNRQDHLVQPNAAQPADHRPCQDHSPKRSPELAPSATLQGHRRRGTGRSIAQPNSRGMKVVNMRAPASPQSGVLENPKRVTRPKTTTSPQMRINRRLFFINYPDAVFILLHKLSTQYCLLPRFQHGDYNLLRCPKHSNASFYLA